METGEVRLREAEALDGRGIARSQRPVTCGEHVGGFLVLNYPGANFTDEDMEVLWERVQETLDREAPWLAAQLRGEVPPRTPLRRPCGGTGS